MSRLMFILVILFLVGPMVAQEGSDQLAQITLKNGTRIKGTIEEMDSEAVVFRATNGQRVRISNDKIKKILLTENGGLETEPSVFDVHLMDGTTIRDVTPGEDNNGLNLISREGEKITLDYPQILSIERAGVRTTHQKAGGKFFHWMEFGGLFGKDDRGEITTAFSVHTINGYRLWNFLEPGLGVGFDFYDGFTTLPVYLSGKADLIKARVIPYYFGSAGYGFAWQNSKSQVEYDQVNGGFTWSAGMGIKIPLERISVVVSAGYRYQKITTITGNLEEMGFETEQNRKIRRFTLTTGITF